MARGLAGRVVAITGASSGIGAATARACARSGMGVGLLARRVERLEALAAEIDAAGGGAEVVPGDVRDEAALERFVTAITRRWGRLDVMIANAGFGIAARVADTPPDEARELFEVNVLGTVWAIQAAWPIFAMQRSGHFVIVSSAAAKHGTPGTTLYSATKAAQMNLAEGLRIEAEILGIDVSVVYPIVTEETEFREAARDHTGGRRSSAAARTGGPRQSAEEVAESIVRCIERPRFEVYPYAKARLLPWLGAVSPKFLARVLGYPRIYRQTMAIKGEMELRAGQGVQLISELAGPPGERLDRLRDSTSESAREE